MLDKNSFDEFITPLTAAGYAAEWWHTGGGCTAIAIQLTDERQVLITDDPDSLCGDEAYINSPTERAERLAAKRAETAHGYPGVTGDGHGFLVGWSGWDATEKCNGVCIHAPDATGDDLPDLVAALLAMVQRRMGGAL